MTSQRYVNAQNQIIAGILSDMDKLRDMIGQLHREQMKIKHRVFPTPPSTPCPPSDSRRPVSVPHNMGVLAIPRDYRPVSVPVAPPSELPPINRVPRPPTAPKVRRSRPNITPRGRPSQAPYAFGKCLMMA